MTKNGKLEIKCDLSLLKTLKTTAKQKDIGGITTFTCNVCNKSFKSWSYEFKNHFASTHIFQSNKICELPPAKKGRRFPPTLLDILEIEEKHFCFFTKNNVNQYKYLRTRKKINNIPSHFH